MDSNNSSKTPNKTTDNSIAIIGMGALFPKSFGLKEYWRLIFHGEDAITDVPKSHWSANDYYSEDHKKPDHTYCKRGGFLSPVSFDPSEFGIPPNLLEAIDTSQILSLVIAKMALTDAGYGDNLRSFDNENTSVYLGVTGTQELVIPLSTRLGHPVWKRALENSGISPEKTEEVIKRISDSYVSWQENSFPGLLGNVVSGRICNRFNLGGTNTVVDAACASSLSAINHAILDLLAGRSNMSITGGVDTLNDIFMHMCFAKTSVLSHSGDAKPFSDSSDGTVLAEGIGMVVLKRLEDAKRDNDRIYAVIKGMGTSSDGKSGSIYAPNSAGQLKALKAAYKEADISPETVGLIEAHGTGTRVGDAVEFNAISELFSQYTDNNKCAIGTVKSMIGHAKAAAGAAGLIKTALSLYHKVLPPTLKADNPDPKLNIKESPFYLNSKSRPWMPSDNHPRRAGVSAFGFGGSNFHAVLEEYCPEKEKISWTGAVEIIAFCANKKEQLLTKLIEFKKLLKQGSSLKDQTEEFSFLAYQTRKSFLSDQNHRLIIVLDRNSIVSEIIDKAVSTFESKNNQSEHNLPNSNLTGNNLPENNLPDSNLPDSNLTGNKNAQSQFAWSVNGIYYGKGKYHGKTAFVFPGQGSQYTYMGRDLLCTFPEAGKVLSNAEVKFNLEAKEKKQTLCDHIYPLPEYMQSKKESEDNLRSTDIAQVSIGAVSIAMNKILKEFGITPEFTCGHSFGELSALCSAGWIDEDTFLSLSIARGKFMAEAGKDGDSGSMLAIRAPLEKIEEFIKQKCPNLILANRNSYDQGVLSGATDDIYLAAKLCKEEKIKAIKLPVAAAFHSSLVKSAVKPKGYRKRVYCSCNGCIVR
ncbi:MAG: hypothetical protein B6I31_03560 [Desulfobacteraceae bacterium 4572_19]|nr:MAG: hypothetical protein B6I31_03560 [Desulfobacteraceae bacterium 4572_19]